MFVTGLVYPARSWGRCLLLLLSAAGILALHVALAQDARPGAEQGSNIYYSHGCSACHGDEGEGSTGPALRGDPKLRSPHYVADQILFGGSGMPPFRHQLSSEQIAQVATFVLNSWGNDPGAIDTDFIEEREALNEDANVASPSGAQVHAWNCMICHG